MEHNHFTTAILSLGFVAVVLFAPNPSNGSVEFNGRCPVCVQRGYRAQVFPGGTLCTLLAPIPYYDEDGNYHCDNPNTSTTDYSCSSGHVFKVVSGGGGETVTIVNSNDVASSQSTSWALAGAGSITNCISNGDFYRFTNCISWVEATLPRSLYIGNVSEWREGRIAFFPGSSNEVVFVSTGNTFRIEYSCTPDEASKAVLDALQESGDAFGFSIKRVSP